MATLSAADLQRRHELEGAPDPFPSLGSNEEPKARRTGTATPSLDTDSHSAFPSLATVNPLSKQPASGAWSSVSAPRIKSASARSSLVSDSFDIKSSDLSHLGSTGKPGSLGDVMKTIMTKFKVKIEASTARSSGRTTFYVKGDTERDVEKAKRQLVALLSPLDTIPVIAPASTIATIIGPKGAKLKQIREQFGVRVDIPRRDSYIGNVVNGHLNGSSQPDTRSGTPLPGSVTEQDEDEPMVTITVHGPRHFVEEAKLHLETIIATRKSKMTSRVRDIPQHILPFVRARHGEFEAVGQDEELDISYLEMEGDAIVNGEREAVGRVIERIKATVEELKSTLQNISVPLPKRQHRLLAGNGGQEILRNFQCAVIVPTAEDVGGEVKVWGLQKDLGAGLQAVLEKANSQYIHELPLPGPSSTALQVLTYIKLTSFVKTLSAEYPSVTIYLPEFVPANKQGNVSIDIIGDKGAVDATAKKLSELINKLTGATRGIGIDWLLHRVIHGKYTKRIKQLQELHNVIVYFPPESAESSMVFLFYDPQSATSSPLVTEKTKHLEEVERELQKLAKDVADVKTEVLTVEKKWHDAVLGEGGTTLNAIIGEDKTLSIKLGHNAHRLVNGNAAKDDNIILIRGTSSDVDRAKQEILRIVEEAKNDEIDNSYSVDFIVNRDYVGRIVGASGVQAKKLREQLGVRLDVIDEPDEKEKEKEGKKKKAVVLKSKVKITGRKENVEEAKRRILGQVERLADETTEILRVPRQYHSPLIGPSGKYVLRLEDKYNVKITFPRDSDEHAESKSREAPKKDEVLIKGGKRGVAGAKAEILEAVEFEKETSNTLKFAVPTRAIPRILGKGGSSINEIKDETDAQIDIEKSDESGTATNITVRGTKEGIAAAKAAVLAIVSSIGDPITITVSVESKYHRTLIGAGGQSLRELIAKCDGPEDPKSHIGLIHFPRQGEPPDEVRLRGERSLVTKLKAELEKSVAVLRDRVVIGVGIPASRHRALIGRGGQNLQGLQERTGAQIQFPGSRSYQHVGEPENASSLKDVEPQDLVKIQGSRDATEKALEELLKPTPETIRAVMEVPLKYHHFVAQQGSFFRYLRTIGVNVDHSIIPTTAFPPRPPVDSRIDDADSAAISNGVQWQVIKNPQNAEEGNSQWTLRAKDEAGLETAKKLVNEAIERAEKASHIGYLTLDDRSVFPKIVGVKGANVSRLRMETGAEIIVGREDNTITIFGSESALAAAKEALLQITEKGRFRA